MKKVLFYRMFNAFKSYTGGHQKLYDYYKHLSMHDHFDVDIVFSEQTLWDKSNPWMGEYKHIVKSETINVKDYDLLFVEGTDWMDIEKGIEEKIPIINLIQAVRHADPDNIRYKFLNRKSIRIAVSKEVASAIKNTNKVSGPIYTIENGHKMPNIKKKKQYDIYILGKKNPKLANILNSEFENLGYKVLCTEKNIYRETVFSNMASAQISIVLPNQTENEGFFLPALESMKYSNITIVPDCVGNRSFCFDKKNCLMPNYTKEDIVNTTIEAINILKNNLLLEEYKKHAKITVDKHSLKNERDAFYNILHKEAILN